MIDKYFFDTDCISSFLWIGKEHIITTLYKSKIILPKQVYNELSNPSIPHIGRKVNELYANKDILIEEIEVASKAYDIYVAMILNPEAGIKRIGKGEAAAIALAKSKNGIIASNNLKDILYYVKKYDLPYITTGDILIEALRKSLIVEKEGNVIWKQMLAKKRKLPTKTFSDFLATYNR